MRLFVKGHVTLRMKVLVLTYLSEKLSQLIKVKLFRVYNPQISKDRPNRCVDSPTF